MHVVEGRYYCRAAFLFLFLHMRSQYGRGVANGAAPTYYRVYAKLQCSAALYYELMFLLDVPFLHGRRASAVAFIPHASRVGKPEQRMHYLICSDSKPFSAIQDAYKPVFR